ncbi:MAG TPA: hypothetical protein VMP11_03880 [Verrucomicrobiae bacterium]|nr:hypothetical protein [Verrucomicrobiae bacterium]
MKFQLLYDGTVQNVRLSRNSGTQLSGLYCMKAITDSAPFEPLPEDLHRIVGSEPRDATITFRY